MNALLCRGVIEGILGLVPSNKRRLVGRGPAVLFMANLRLEFLDDREVNCLGYRLAYLDP